MGLSNKERQRRWLANPENRRKHRERARQRYHERKKADELEKILYGFVSAPSDKRKPKFTEWSGDDST